MHVSNDALLDQGGGSSMMHYLTDATSTAELMLGGCLARFMTSNLWAGLMLLTVLLCNQHGLADNQSSTLNSHKPNLAVCGRPP